jgi:hypothetical protein
VTRAQRVLEQLRVALTSGTRHLSLELVPPELGRLSIHVALRRGRVSAIVRSESAVTHELLESHVPELRALLARAGLAADDVELRLGFGQHERRPAAPPAPPRAPSARPDRPTAVQDVARSSAPAQVGAVDTYA